MNHKINLRQIIDLRDFIPQKIKSGRFGNTYPIKIEEVENHYLVYYLTTVHSKYGIYSASKKYFATIKKIS